MERGDEGAADYERLSGIDADFVPDLVAAVARPGDEGAGGRPAGRARTRPGGRPRRLRRPRRGHGLAPRVPRVHGARRDQGPGPPLARTAAARIPLAATMAIGDQYNDLEMLAAAGHGVAMAGCAGRGPCRGPPFTASVEDEGFAAGPGGAGARARQLCDGPALSEPRAPRRRGRPVGVDSPSRLSSAETAWPSRPRPSTASPAPARDGAVVAPRGGQGPAPRARASRCSSTSWRWPRAWSSCLPAARRLAGALLAGAADAGRAAAARRGAARMLVTGAYACVGLRVPDRRPPVAWPGPGPAAADLGEPLRRAEARSARRSVAASGRRGRR